MHLDKIITNASISQGPLGKPSWHPTDLSSEKITKTQTLVINIDSEERLKWEMENPFLLNTGKE